LRSDALSELTRLVDRPSRALITGAAGFAGTHLVRELQQSTAWQVVGLVRRTRAESLRDRYTEVAADIMDLAALRQILREVQPEYIFHLAAATPPSTDEEIFLTNVGGATALLEATLAECRRARLLIVGSDAQYGPLPASHLPTRESAPMRPTGAYGRSKVLQEQIAMRYRRMADLRVVCVRPFNQIGPGQSDLFVVGALAKQIAMIEAGLAPGPVEIGDLSSARDFTDVRDSVRAYVLSLALGLPGYPYNIGTGAPRSIRDIAEMLLNAARVPIGVRSATERVRTNEVRVTQADCERLRRRTGWAPRIPVERTILDTLEYWRGAEDTGRVKSQVHRSGLPA
jgi:GDP-4-dehydro-6-deoxy-D-mannose reductase